MDIDTGEALRLVFVAMAETQMFKNDTVLVTTARFVAGGATYAMASVSSVSIAKEETNRMMYGILGVFGVFVTLVSVRLMMIDEPTPGNMVAFILGVSAALGLLLAFKRDQYWIVLQTTAGTVRAFDCKDANTAATVCAAIEQAIVARG